VAILGFDAQADPLAGLQRVFNVDEATARAVLANLPTIACRQVNRTRAEHFARALRSIGARVEFFDRNGAPVDAAGRVVKVPEAAPANDVVPERHSSARAATLFLGSAATLEAMPAPVIAAPRPSQAAETQQQHAPWEIELAPESEAIPLETQARPEASSPWGELQRKPLKARPASQPLAAWSESDQLRTRPQELEIGGPALSIEPPRPSHPPHVPSVAPLPPVFAHMPAPAPVSLQPSAAPVRVAPAMPAQRQLPTPVHDGSFWEGFADALMYPWQGRGVAWLISIALWSVCVHLLTAMSQVVPFVSWGLLFMANSSLLAFAADYHRRCMWGVANAEQPLEEGPDFDPTRIWHGYMRSGANLSVFLIVSQIPLVSWVISAVSSDGIGGLAVLLSKRFWLLACLPALYWPMAVATASLYNRFSGVWYLPVGLRAIARAPLEYLVIFATGAFVFLCPWLVCALIARAAGLPSAFVLAISGLPLAASHGVMGALTGQLMQAKSDLFE
jgi:hypothetical protein